MSYIQVEFLGKLRDLSFNQAALVEVQLKNGDNLGNYAWFYYAVIWGGLIGGCIENEQRPDFTWKEVCAAADKLDPGVAAKITECYKSTMPPVEDKKKEEVKKPPRRNTKPNALK